MAVANRPDFQQRIPTLAFARSGMHRVPRRPASFTLRAKPDKCKSPW
jgi:hypothetical protein